MPDLAEQIAERLWRNAPLATGGVCGPGQDQWKRVVAELIRNTPGFAGAVEDRARLDWLEQTGFSCPSDVIHGVHSWRERCTDKWMWTARCIFSEYTNVRDAIDAARAKQGGAQ